MNNGEIPRFFLLTLAETNESGNLQLISSRANAYSLPTEARKVGGIFFGNDTSDEAVSVVPVFAGDELHSDPSVGVCCISWLCVIYSESWSRPTA